MKQTMIVETASKSRKFDNSLAMQKVKEILPFPDYEQIKTDFLTQLQEASRGKPSSISFIRHHFPEHPIVETGRIQGLVIGGTNFITAEAYVRPDGTIIEEPKTRREGKVPIITDANALFTFIEQYIQPDTEAVGINFAFPLKPVIGLSYDELDGILANTTKEHSFTGLVNGIAIGDGIRKHTGRHDLAVSVANDTICLGKNALVVGTGFNIAYTATENGKRIPVNLEAGNFDTFEAPPELEAIDSASDRPGSYLFEKMISGQYLYQHYNLLAKKLGLEPATIDDTSKLSELAKENNASALLARRLLNRSARLVASALAAISEFAEKPLTFTVDGSLFWEGYRYKEAIQQQLRSFAITEDAITFEERNTDAALQGAFHLLTRTQ